MDEPISHLPEKEEVKLLTIDKYHEVIDPCMFGKSMFLYTFYFL